MFSVLITRSTRSTYKQLMTWMDYTSHASWSIILYSVRSLFTMFDRASWAWYSIGTFSRPRQLSTSLKTRIVKTWTSLGMPGSSEILAFKIVILSCREDCQWNTSKIDTQILWNGSPYLYWIFWDWVAVAWCIGSGLYILGGTRHFHS